MKSTSSTSRVLRQRDILFNGDKESPMESVPCDFTPIPITVPTTAAPAVSPGFLACKNSRPDTKPNPVEVIVIDDDDDDDDDVMDTVQLVGEEKSNGMDSAEDVVM